jgi:hypothetical protein
VASLEGWARPAAVLAEAAIIAGVLYRSPMHPVWSVLGVALAAAAIALILTDAGPETDDDCDERPPEREDVTGLAVSRH